jgi:hypothetical protein
MVEQSGFELLTPTLERKVGSSNPLCFWREADEPERDGERADLADRLTIKASGGPALPAIPAAVGASLHAQGHARGRRDD